MKWTTDNPTQPGWYWMRAESGTFFMGGIPAQVVRVRRSRDSEELTFIPRGWTTMTVEVEYARGIEWAGPIPIPDEP